MTFQDIITETRAIVQQTNPANSQASDTTILGWANACTLQLCSTISTLPKTSVAGIVAASTLTLGQTLLKIDFASISDGATPAVHAKLETTDFVNFVRQNPDWENQVASKPAKLVRMTDLTWMMFPSPDATWTGKSVTIVGSVLPAPATSTTEQPPVSIAMHPAYPHYCAWKFFLVLNNPERAGMEYSLFDGIRKLNTQTTTSTTGSLLSLKMGGF